MEKLLSITKEDIGEKISVKEYNEECRKNVLKYKKDWELLTKEMGYWVDMENPYITYENKYIKCLVAFKRILQKRLALQRFYNTTIFTKSWNWPEHT